MLLALTFPHSCAPESMTGLVNIQCVAISVCGGGGGGGGGASWKQG